MKNFRDSLLLAILFSCLTFGCRNGRQVEKIIIGNQTIIVDGSTGVVRVLLIDHGSRETEVMNTHAAQNAGWSVKKLSPERFRLTTGDLGDFDIFKHDETWVVVPSGTYLSPSKTKAVTVKTDGTGVRIRIGEIEVPYTDMWVSDEVFIPSVTPEQLTVRWRGEKYAEVSDGSGNLLARLTYLKTTKE